MSLTLLPAVTRDPTISEIYSCLCPAYSDVDFFIFILLPNALPKFLTILVFFQLIILNFLDVQLYH